MTYELQLRDYKEGYRFRLLCGACRYSWYLAPKDLLGKPGVHLNIYLSELRKILPCPQCRQKNSQITPLIIRTQHSFIGGLA